MFYSRDQKKVFSVLSAYLCIRVHLMDKLTHSLTASLLNCVCSGLTSGAFCLSSCSIFPYIRWMSVKHPQNKQKLRVESSLC